MNLPEKFLRHAMAELESEIKSLESFASIGLELDRRTERIDWLKSVSSYYQELYGDKEQLEPEDLFRKNPDRNVVIDLSEYLSFPHLVGGLVHEDFGRLLRSHTRLDEIESRFDTVEILFPENLFTVSQLFLRGFIGASVKKYGRDGFRKKFRITLPSHLVSLVDSFTRYYNELM